ncbi:unnamed protein product [Allacma fusca]|uniref:Uncharacterized protein n=1 Tax=Allacma fusca TaxID=39272 RepID=A0A8J2JPM5_9HEXA|nr:unnamed protein product [Allacma fusca]
MIAKDDVLKVSGKTELAVVLGADAKRPIILDSNHGFTQLLISFYHCKGAKIGAAPNPTMMGILPEDSLEVQEKPFEVSGVDFFDPIGVANGRRTVRRYGVLFTCLSVRAVHLEIVKDLTTDAAINAIRRFVARFGTRESPNLE